MWLKMVLVVLDVGRERSKMRDECSGYAQSK